MRREAAGAGPKAGKVVSFLGGRRKTAASPEAEDAASAKALPRLRGRAEERREVLPRMFRGPRALKEAGGAPSPSPDSWRRWLAPQAVPQIRMPLYAGQPPSRVSARQVAMQAVRREDAHAIHANRRHSPSPPQEPDDRPHHPTVNGADRAGPCVRQLPDRLLRVQLSAWDAIGRIVCTAAGYTAILLA